MLTVDGVKVEGHNESQLKEGIISLSVAETWEEARREWWLKTIYDDSWSTCLCGHYPIREYCVLKNAKNGNITIVGNVCVNKFMGIDSEKLFAALRRVSLDITRAFNPTFVQWAHERGWMNAWERAFYLDTWRKRKLTGRQAVKREQINKWVMNLIRVGSKINVPTPVAR